MFAKTKGVFSKASLIYRLVAAHSNKNPDTGKLILHVTLSSLAPRIAQAASIHETKAAALRPPCTR
jgi:hypothetical protein